jgi:hypothetical protein
MTVPPRNLALLIAGDSDDLLALETALRGDADGKGASLVRVVRDPAPGEMGGVVEALTWAADNKELLAALCAALTAWVASRRTRVRVRVGKREVQVSSTAIPDPEALALTLIEAMRKQDEDV